MTPVRLWIGLGGYWLAAVAILVVARPAPDLVASAGLRATAGAVAGLMLFAALARRMPASAPPPALVLVIVASAAAEEIVWRGFVLTQIADHVSAAAGLAASTCLFAIAHGRLRFSRVAAGAVFGGVYLAGGGILGAACAHAVYNTGVAGAVAARAVPVRGG